MIPQRPMELSTDNTRKQETEQALTELWQAILDIDGVVYPKLKDWSTNYFLEHKNRYRSDLEHIRQWYTEGTIVEIGSLPCHTTYLLKKLHLPTIGIDLNPERCESFIKQYHLNVLKCDIENDPLPFESNSTNLIIFSETFEHLRIDPIKTLRELHRILASDGILILTTPNLYSLKNIVLFNLGKSINNALEEFQKLEIVGHMGHIREYSAKEMTAFLTNTGFKVIHHEFNSYHTSRKRIIGSGINLLHARIKKIRPFQIIICKK